MEDGKTMLAYASLTRSPRNVAALRAYGWRFMLSPTETGRLDPRGFAYAIDNGAWSYHQAGAAFDGARFLAVVDALGAGADFIVLPDIVAGGLRSLELSLSFVDRLRGVAPLLVPVQDGMTAADVAALPADLGVFVGGSTAYKERWLCARHDVGARYVHVGRVNTVRRMRLCHLAGADSFDGTSASRFSVTVPMLDRARLAFAVPNPQMELFSCVM